LVVLVLNSLELNVTIFNTSLLASVCSTDL